MNKKGILKIEQDFRDTLENQLAKNQEQNRKVKIKDIKPVGVATWTDKVNGEEIRENVYKVEKEIIETNELGETRTSYQINFYLGDEPVAAVIGVDEIVYENKFQSYELDRMEAVKGLIDNVQEVNMEKYSLKNLEREEMLEVLTEHLGRKVTEEEVENMLKDLDKGEIEKLKEDKQQIKDEESLSKKQVEEIKVNGIQKADLNKKVDGKETLGKRLDLEEYDSLYVVYSHNVDEITSGLNRNTTTYSLVGMTKEGEAKVLNDEFEIDSSVGCGGNRSQTKIRADSTATRDNSDISVYRRKSNGVSIGCENIQGSVNMYFYKKTIEENENIGIQLETSKTPVIPIEAREIMNRNKGVYHNDLVQDEAKEHIDEGCTIKDERDFDGDMETSSHIHIDINKIDVNENIPNTTITWQEFMNKCGYRGEDALETAVRAIEGLGENINNEVVEDFIEEKEEEFRTIDNNI